MNKNNLISLIVLDIAVMLLSLGLIVFRYNAISSVAISSAIQKSAPKPAVSQSTATAVSAPVPAPEAEEKQKKPVSGKSKILPAVETRNIAFVYRNSRAKKVEIIGDFNDWIPAPLKKGKDFKWNIKVALPPGEYAYNFVVDGKPVRDSNNSKVCDVGRGFPNSYLKVKPLKNDKEKGE